MNGLRNKKAIRISIAYRPLETCLWGGGVFNQLHLGGGGGLQPTSPGGGGSSTNFTWGEGRRYPSCIAARCYQCAHLWSKGGTEGLHLLFCCVALHHGILPAPPPCEQKDRNSENITFAILCMRAVMKFSASPFCILCWRSRYQLPSR